MSNAPETPSFFNKPTTRETAAASLLVVGRLALAEYAAKRGHDLTLLTRMHDEAVATWVDAWDCDRAQVENAISKLHANLCDGADIDNHIAQTVPSSPSTRCVGH